MNIHWLSLVKLAHAVTVDVGFGGPSGGTGENIADYIKNIYIYGVSIAGILAVGVIVFGAIYYAVSGGNPDKQRDAKSMITGALWGVALLLGSYLILNTINPQITTLSTLQQTKTCGSSEDPKTSGCVPEAPIIKPICGTSTSTDCIPACETGQRACVIGEATSTGCVQCAYQVAQCRQTAFRLLSGQDVACEAGTYKEVFLSGPYVVPDCGQIPPDSYAPGSPKNCSKGVDDARFFNADGVNFEDGVARVAPYYPGDLGPEQAQCVIYAYIRSLEESEATSSTSSVQSSRWERAKLNGFKPC
ncbi:MAG: hypothetical protein UY26_C0001G0048 [Candidatus Jorgensenbacteria bacterium GW2011_GWA1_48_13]|uniref:Uncharacterized protein n=2 Tax=Candidatus Joergenseniibacteriota TaxID=1752739 RepID=A0A0G1Z8E9_9BACT|nr:MAG: hypothetical protein UY26_C0001G0048 [Candidatus Jorgensenbacteria bacterium GW2011_GWA1_48_13]KKU99066.1 MAG: hypothetical protein UY32_C0007G0010 [Candidatus Jorgensenbacteria bacterium GW2011_GWC1_48_8]KKW15294.1 MAG: hypothetical protein UY55_C0001G0048 [Candidatus Jorgensenbacteria bacterium GW2011_GWB1_50_10]